MRRVSSREEHFEEFVCLADVTYEAVLLAWGGFWFRRDGPDQRWRLVPDVELGEIDPGRTGTHRHRLATLR